ncbi:MAG: hypothetical protein B0W54_15800 [Cellvibrio sp. 79]|nr:MAG: hypothetical protein B0W54_15800 [Cellvibrio sp. 79]
MFHLLVYNLLTLDEVATIARQLYLSLRSVGGSEKTTAPVEVFPMNQERGRWQKWLIAASGVAERPGRE